MNIQFGISHICSIVLLRVVYVHTLDLENGKQKALKFSLCLFTTYIDVILICLFITTWKSTKTSSQIVYHVQEDEALVEPKGPFCKLVPRGRPRSEIVRAERAELHQVLALATHEVVALLAAVDPGGGPLQADGALWVLAQRQGGEVQQLFLLYHNSSSSSCQPLLGLLYLFGQFSNLVLKLRKFYSIC